MASQKTESLVLSFKKRWDESRHEAEMYNTPVISPSVDEIEALLELALEKTSGIEDIGKDLTMELLEEIDKEK